MTRLIRPPEHNDVIRIALDEGATLAGIADCRAPIKQGAAFEHWLDQNLYGPMLWMQNHRQLRLKPAGLLPGARSVLCIAVSYNHPCFRSDSRPQISAYARGRDYHKVLKKMLARVARRLEQQFGNFAWRVCVDSAPILERYWAWRAGLGWIGKNCMLINREHGSGLFLGELLCDLDLEVDSPGNEFCGSCERCLHACPTKAFVSPGVLDAARCISGQTIENRRDDLPEQMKPMPQNWLFGCDTCQLVCPWSQRALRKGRRGHPDFIPDPDLEELLESGKWPESHCDTMQQQEQLQEFWERLTVGKSLRRMTASMFERNLKAVQSGQSTPDGTNVREARKS